MIYYFQEKGKTCSFFKFHVKKRVHSSNLSKGWYIGLRVSAGPAFNRHKETLKNGDFICTYVSFGKKPNILCHWSVQYDPCLKTPHAFGCNSGELGIGEVQWHGVKSKSESNPNDPSGPSQTQSVRSLFLGNSNWVVHLGQVPEFLSGLLFNGIKLVYTILYYILTRKFIYRLGTNDVNGSTSVGIPGVSKIQSDLRGKICSWIWIQHGFCMLDCIWH